MRYLEEKYHDENDINILSGGNSPDQGIELVDSTNKCNNTQTSKQKEIILPWNKKVDVKHTKLSAKRCGLDTDQKENNAPVEQIPYEESIVEDSKGEYLISETITRDNPIKDMQEAGMYNEFITIKINH